MPAIKPLFVLAAALLLVACGGGEDRSKAQLRLVNASAEYAALDLVVDDTLRQSSVAYAATDAYVEIDPDETDTEVFRSGTSTALVSSTPALAAGDRYTLVAYGGEGALAAVLLDDNAEAADDGEARVRVLNAAPEAGDVDVYLTAEDADLADAEALQPGAVAGEVGAFVIVDATTWRLRITGAGDREDLRLDVSGIALASGQVVTVVVTPARGGVLVNALVLTQRGAITALDGTQARARAIAAVTDSGAVAARVGDVSLMNGTGAPAAGDYVLVPGGAAAVSVSVNGSAVDGGTPTLEAGTDHTLLVWGEAAAPTASWIADDNRPPTVSGRAKLRLVHVIAGLDAPLALTLDFSPVADDVAPGTASAAAEVDAVSLGTLTVTATGLAQPVWSAAEQVLEADGVYTLFIVGPASAPVGILRRDR